MGSKVLLVEDDRDLRDAVAELLRIEGFDPVCAANGKEALDYLQAGGTPRLILLDLMMPTMDGERFRQVERLFYQALELDAAERGTFMTEACAADATLRGEVESLLDAHDRVGSFLHAPASAGQ